MNAFVSTSSENLKFTSETDASEAPSALASPPSVRTADWRTLASTVGMGRRRAKLSAPPTLGPLTGPADARAAAGPAPSASCCHCSTMAVTLAPSRPR